MLQASKHTETASCVCQCPQHMLVWTKEMPLHMFVLTAYLCICLSVWRLALETECKSPVSYFNYWIQAASCMVFFLYEYQRKRIHLYIASWVSYQVYTGWDSGVNCDFSMRTKALRETCVHLLFVKMNALIFPHLAIQRENGTLKIVFILCHFMWNIYLSMYCMYNMLTFSEIKDAILTWS